MIEIRIISKARQLIEVMYLWNNLSLDTDIPSRRVAISSASLFDIVLIVFNILDIVTTSEHELSLIFLNQYSLMIFGSILSHDDDMADMNSQAACEKEEFTHDDIPLQMMVLRI